MKHSKLLRWLLAPFFFHLDDDDTAAAIARGDIIAEEDQAKPEDKAEDAGKAEDGEKAADDKAQDTSGKKGEDEEDEDEEDEKDDKAEAKAKPRKDSRIPLSRHKDLLEKERSARAAAEAELAKLRQTRENAQVDAKITAAETKLDGMEAEYAKLITDGETEKAAKVMREMRALERSIVEQKTELRVQASTTAAVEQIRYDTTVERLEAAYPVINPDHDDYDADVVAEMADMAGAYQAKGMTATEAIQKAAKYVLKPRTAAQKEAVDVTPRVSSEDKAAAERDARKAAQVKKNLDAADKTPPATGAVGKDSDKAGGGVVDSRAIMKMSQDDFAKLTEEQLAKMRGDTL